MKKSIANKWVRALRSGKYKQAKGTLVQFDNEGEKWSVIAAWGSLRMCVILAIRN